MSYIYDAIMESNQLEDDQVLSKLKAEKNPPTLKRRLHMDEECKEEKLKEEKEEEVKEEELPEGHEELDEEKLTEEKMVDIEQYLGPENYVESFNRKSDEVLGESLDKTITETVELPNRSQKGRPGSPEYDSNDNRRKRVARYRKNANIDESYNITEENINDWALTRTCTQYNCPKERLKAELLRQPYTGLERYDED